MDHSRRIWLWNGWTMPECQRVIDGDVRKSYRWSEGNDADSVLRA